MVQLGWVYILTNPAIKGLIKIGYSTRDPVIRAHEMKTTGVPHEFILQYDVLLYNPRKFEKEIHRKLESFNEKKEWFGCTKEFAISTIQKITKEHSIEEHLWVGNEVHSKVRVVETKSSSHVIHRLDKEQFFKKLAKRKTYFKNRSKTDELLFLEAYNHRNEQKECKLSFHRDGLKEVEFLSKQPDITHLDLSFNQLQNIGAVTTLKRLKLINLTKNNLYDLSPLSENTELEDVYFSENFVNDLTFLKELRSVKKVDASKNNISSLCNLSKLGELEELNLWKNSVSSLDGIETINCRHKLILSGNQISDLSPLTKRETLYTHLIHLKNNKIEIVDPVCSLKNVEEIDLSNNQIKNVDPLLEKLPFFRINLSGNPIPLPQIEKLRNKWMNKVVIEF